MTLGGITIFENSQKLVITRRIDFGYSPLFSYFYSSYVTKKLSFPLILSTKNFPLPAQFSHLHIIIKEPVKDSKEPVPKKLFQDNEGDSSPGDGNCYSPHSPAYYPETSENLTRKRGRTSDSSYLPFSTMQVPPTKKRRSKADLIKKRGIDRDQRKLNLGVTSREILDTLYAPFNYETNKTGIAQIAASLDMSILNSSTDSNENTVMIARAPLNENINFEQDFISQEMFEKYDVQLSSCIQVFKAGQVVTINENQEYAEFMEIVRIENSNQRFLQEEF